MIGQMATHRMTFATMPNRKSGDFRLKWNTIEKVKYGYAFNRTHQAILRVYRLLEAIHKIGGDAIKRIHTDSFALSADCVPTIETEIFALLDDKGFGYSCKAQGTAHFFELNSGIIGRKFIGVPFEIREKIKNLPQKPRRVFITDEQLERWGIRGVVSDTGVPNCPSVHVQEEQLELEIENEQRPAANYQRFA